MSSRQTLLNNCAPASTAAEAHYRIDAPVGFHRRARVIAFGSLANEVVHWAESQTGDSDRFLTYLGIKPPSQLVNSDIDVQLRRIDGTETTLDDELASVLVDVVMLIAAGDVDPLGVKEIGTTCMRLGIATVGVVLGDRHVVSPNVTALRPYSRVLLVSTDKSDVLELLSALRT